MNKQRESIYKKRRNALYGDRLELDIADNVSQYMLFIVSSYQEDRNFEGFQRACISILACESPVDDKQFFQEKEDDIADKLYDVCLQPYKPRLLKMSEKAMPIIQIVYEREGNRYENIAIP
jgi:preprotein translocase subunit SecA